jgi:hypothetical protein
MNDVDYILLDDVTPLELENSTVIRCVCHWCRRVYATKDGQGVVGDSHGICDLCCTDCGRQVPLHGPHRLCRACLVADESHLLGEAP